MWQVITLPDGEKRVIGSLSADIVAIFLRTGGVPFLNILSMEPRVFDKKRLPILTVDGKHVCDFNDLVNVQRALPNEEFYVINDHSFIGRIWAADPIDAIRFMLNLYRGNNLHIQVFFDPSAIAEYNISLMGLADACGQAFPPMATTQAATSQASGVTASAVLTPPDVAIDRAAIRSMVEDHWRSFIFVATTGPQIGAQSIHNFEDRIQATASLMVADKAKMFIRAIEEEREVLFNEYRRNPDALKRRLGLGPVNRPNLVVRQHQRQSIGEMAVRTAVRATIWETVISLFRGFR